jgi:transcriptional regulator with XRE-family HTH domain
VVSEDATDLPRADCRPPVQDENREADGATVLPFPSNRPLTPDPTVAATPRLSDVLGEVLRDERHRQERTLADVAESAAVSLPYLSEVERGRKEVSSDGLRAIGDALDLPLVTILERAAERLRIDVTMSIASTSNRSKSIRSGEFRMQRRSGFQLAA